MNPASSVTTIRSLCWPSAIGTRPTLVWVGLETRSWAVKKVLETELAAELGSEGLRRERVAWRMKKVELMRMLTRMKKRRCSLKR
ncbi:UDP-glucuronic acid decarboxylase 1-like [Pyrus ussuriensis x Pyrus communis]|uniref:UDP-glucuronic acid decarboxylase 1-like n=1 Tax=Pyrus ussuriensis x Pyrus communis TaxID=2448454 RepID=A0A5N5HHN6_9ROSA|nr:UDP-glucuronic acid decarboxylase 1-like [Pyrus ussuriensis x Pyrus communis]